MFLPRNSVGAGSVGKPGSAPAGRVGLVRDHLHPGASKDVHAQNRRIEPLARTFREPAQQPGGKSSERINRPLPVGPRDSSSAGYRCLQAHKRSEADLPLESSQYGLGRSAQLDKLDK